MTISPIATSESEERLSEIERFLDENEIHGSLIDLDDTLVHTHVIFDDFYQRFCTSICEKLNLDSNKFISDANVANSAAHVERGVNPNRWEYYLEHLAATYGHKDTFMAYEEHFAGIYKVIPEVRDGAKEFIRELQVGGRKVCVVTHANLGWTYLKLGTTGLGYLIDELVVADENKPKSPEDWAAGLTALNINGENALAVGDNVIGDIGAATKAGVKHRVLLPADWALYGEGDIPDRTVVLKNHCLGDVLPSLMDHLGWNGSNIG